MDRSLSPARLAGETFDQYKERRRLNEYVAATRFVHISSQIVTLPPEGKDEKTDEAVRQGFFRDVQAIVTPSGDEIRVARTKGITYRKPKNVVT